MLAKIQSLLVVYIRIQDAMYPVFLQLCCDIFGQDDAGLVDKANLTDCPFWVKFRLLYISCCDAKTLQGFGMLTTTRLLSLNIKELYLYGTNMGAYDDR